jgi:trehalose synthase-fused probable maltokinase
MHGLLASDLTDPRFAPEEPSAQSIDLIRASIDEEIVELFGRLPDQEELAALGARVEEVRELVRAIEPVGDLGRRIRQHGDFHLGQALWSGDDWVLIDFEGEPARPVAERRGKRLPLRDVAGMLRSISYAAWVARLDRGTEVPGGWEADARTAFLDGYQEVVEPLRLLPALRETTRDLLNLFELEKAVYELRYELDHRPDWARIPAAGIVALLGGEER